MSKYRKSHGLRVAYGFSGRIQDEMEAYQGFLEVADEMGWQVWLLHEHFETQLRRLLEKGLVDAVVGNFISAHWLETLPAGLGVVHRGESDLGEAVFSVSLDMFSGMKQVESHLEEMGYERFFVYSPKRVGEMSWIRSRDSLRDILQTEEPVGVFCTSDFLAREGIHIARSVGRQVPEQVGFVGVGDRRLDRLLAEIDISSLPEPHREMGRQAAWLLQECMEGGEARQIKVSPGQLIARQSSRRQEGVVALKARLDEWLLPMMSDPPPVEDWARRMGMSRRSFENAFSRDHGVTPYVYFMQRRVQEAQRLLRETDWTISRIGQAVGIPDPPRFSAFFRKHTGKTPSAWRTEP
ncbi:helix-turn-helix domain-containing protein [Kiritimatiellaeota bacterium B1221]|nr:helix-turn-helix domain-containing protein [Kiritimatiellaeota bacterium B1221]